MCLKTYKKSSGTSKYRFVDLFKGNKKQFIVLFSIVGIIILGIVLLYQFSLKQEFDSSFLVTGDTIKIGLRTDVKGFGEQDDEGNLVGFDRDFIDEALKRMLPDKEKLIEYSPITSQNAGSNIKYGITNMNLGLIVDGTKKVASFRISKPYYTDHVVAVVQGSSRLDRLTNIDGGQLGIFSADIPEKDIEAYLKKNDLNEKFLRYFDYESAMTDIEQNRVNAIIMPYAIARQFEAAGFRILAEPLFEIGYSVMLPTGQVGFVSELNHIIDEMERDGTLAALRAKWGL